MEYVLSFIGLPDTSFKRVFAPLSALVLHIHDHFIPTARNNYHPHILGHRALGLFSLLVVAAKISAIIMLTFGPITPAFSEAITVGNIITLTNQSRQQYSEANLTENQLLDQAAQAKADDMLAKGYFAHNTPDGRTPWSFITAAGYSYLEAGENLAVNFTEAENVESAWMNSPEHKANILNKDFQEIGIGISQGVYQGHEAIFVVQEFGTPSPAQVALSNTPTVVQKAVVPTPAPKVAIAPKPLPITTSSNPQTLGAVQTPAPPAPITITSATTNLNGDNLQISVQIQGPASEVIAYFGQQAVMLNPSSDGSWNGQIAISALAQSNTTVKVKASGMNGQTAQYQLADFSQNTQDNYNLAGTTPTTYVKVLGLSIDPNNFLNRFYLLFIAALLTSLIMAIAIKKHVQHLPVIINACFVIILTVLIWHGG